MNSSRKFLSGARRLPAVCAMLAMAAASAMAQTQDAAAPAPATMSSWDRVSSAEAWRGPGHWRLAMSPHTEHWHYSPEHRHVFALALERQYEDRWLLGGSLFRNSFGQPSGYVYLGKRTENLFGQPQLFFQWSAGMMYGYVGKYQDKVPLNVSGFSPVALVGLGWQLNRQWSGAVHVLGTAGAMLQVAYDFR